MENTKKLDSIKSTPIITSLFNKYENEYKFSVCITSHIKKVKPNETHQNI